MWNYILIKEEVEQYTKADHNACHTLCIIAKLAPHYGGLVPPLCDYSRVEVNNNKHIYINDSAES